MILQVLGVLKGIGISPDCAITEDEVLSLHTLTSYIMVFMAFLVTGKMYLGEPIICSLNSHEWEKSIPKAMLDTHCYVHGTFTVHENTLDEETLYPFRGMGPKKSNQEHMFHRYYQWVNLVLLLQAGTFYLPRLVWRYLECCTMLHLRQGLRDPVQQEDDRQAQIDKIVKYLVTCSNSISGDRLYGRRYMVIYMLSVLNTILQFYLTDIFLNQQFLGYFNQVFKHGRMHQDKVFPKYGKCTFNRYGSSGTIENLDALCLLPLNILNEKLYLVLWFWFMTLLTISTVGLLYWLLHLVSPEIRIYHLHHHLKARVRPKQLKVLNNSFGDWFLVHLLHKNIDRTAFLQVIKRVCDPGLKEDLGSMSMHSNRVGDLKTSINGHVDNGLVENLGDQQQMESVSLRRGSSQMTT